MRDYQERDERSDQVKQAVAAIQSAAMIQAPVAAAATPKAQTTGEPLSGPLRDSPADR